MKLSDFMYDLPEERIAQINHFVEDSRNED